jgi:PEGA domain
MRRTAALAAALALCLVSTAASAETTVAVLGVEAVDAPVNSTALLANALKNRVRKTSGFKLVAGKDLDEIKLVFGCVDEKPTCMARAGKSLQAVKLVWGSLKKVSGGYNLTIKWLDVPRARVEKFVSENIGAQRVNQARADAIIARLTGSFLVSSNGTIKISSNVSGAQVMLGPRVLGQTDAGAVVLRDVPSGTHLVRVTKDGYRPWTQQVMVRGGETTELEAELEPVKAGDGPIPMPLPKPKPSGNTGWKIAFWTGAAVTVGLAVGMGVTGAQVMGLEDDKEDAILKYRETTGLNHFDAQTDDVCSAKEIESLDAEALKKICDDGQTNATIANVLLGGMLAVAALSGYFYYKAYIDEPSSASPDEDSLDEAEESAAARRSIEASAVRWNVTSSAGPQGAGLGLNLQF